MAETSQDVNSTVSPLSNSGLIPDIDDVNRLLAQGRQIRAIDRIKEEIRSENQFNVEIAEARANSSRQQAGLSHSQGEDNTLADNEESENQSPTNRAPLRTTRFRRQTQHYGEVVPSTLKKIFYIRGEDTTQSTFTVTNVSSEDNVINREMLINSREEELKGWMEFKVVREVPLSEMIRCNV